MKLVLSYFKISFKRTVKCLPSMVLITIILSLILSLTAYALICSDQSSAENLKIKVGIVGDLSDSFLQMNFLKLIDIDELSLSIDFIEMSNDEAMSALERHEISAYVFVPDKFISKLASGDDTKLSIIILRSAAEAPAMLFNETVQVISPLITESESCIFAMSDYARSVGDEKVYDKNIALALEYIDTLLNRAKAVSINNIGTDSLSVIQYYILGLMIYFVFLLGISMYSYKNLSLCRLLCAKGLKPWSLVFCEYLCHAGVIYFSIVLIGGVISYASRLTDIFDSNAIFSSFIGLLPYALMISALQMVILEFSENIGTYVSSLFIVSTALAYISGVFYPYYFFPRIIQELSAILPLGLSFQYLRSSALANSYNGWSLSILYTAIFLTAAVIIRRMKIRKERA